MFWKRISQGEKEAAAAVDEGHVDEAVQAAASQRLGRLVSRQRDEVAEAGAAQGELTARLAAQFADCAFFQLGVPLDAAPSDIHQAVDDLSFAEDIDPQALSQAQAELLSPRDRLVHELAWLPGGDPAFQQRACAALKAGDIDGVDALRFATSGLARINLGCALLAVRPGDEALLARLLTDLARWQLHESHAWIDEARLRAGLRPVEAVHFNSAAASRREAIAVQIAEVAAATREGRQALANAIADNAESVRGASSPAIEAVIAAYAGIVDPRLHNMQAKIVESIASLKENPQQPARLTSIIATLDLWSQLRLPLQRLEQARGLDDPLSASLFGELRDLGVRLANEHSMHGETLRLAKSLKHAFAAVPGLQPMLERDLPTIIGNVLSDVLVDRARDAMMNISKFAAELRNHGFAAGTGGPRASRLIDCFQQFNEAQSDADAPFVVLRELGIALNNKAFAPLLAMQVIEFLLDHHPPASIAAQLTQDMCQLQRRINNKR